MVATSNKLRILYAGCLLKLTQKKTQDHNIYFISWVFTFIFGNLLKMYRQNLKNCIKEYNTCEVKGQDLTEGYILVTVQLN